MKFLESLINKNVMLLVYHQNEFLPTSTVVFVDLVECESVDIRFTLLFFLWAAMVCVVCGH